MRFTYLYSGLASSLFILLTNKSSLFAQAELEIEPSPPSIGADVPVTYFGPPPSSVQKELIGPYQLLTAGKIDQNAGTIEMPLYRGPVVQSKSNLSNFVDGVSIWYILTDTTDEGAAKGLGLNLSSKLRFSNVGNGARWSTVGQNTRLLFDQSSYVNFRPVRTIIPGNAPNYFPPKAGTAPGSIGLNNYSPITHVENLGEVYNAPVIADRLQTEETLNRYCDGLPTDRAGLAAARRILHDRVVAICPRDGTVTLTLVPGHSFARPVLYISTESSDRVTAALEFSTYAPGLLDVTVGGDDSFTSAVERIFVVTNGFTNGDLGESATITNHPGRNGLNSALRGDGGPLNVLGGIPTIATDYSPLWDVNLGTWTPEAVRDGYRTRWLEEFQILGFAERGLVTGPDGQPFGSTGIIVNCPIAFRFL
jgi:hypothetical protein